MSSKEQAKSSGRLAYSDYGAMAVPKAKRSTRPFGGLDLDPTFFQWTSIQQHKKNPFFDKTKTLSLNQLFDYSKNIFKNQFFFWFCSIKIKHEPSVVP